MFGKKYEYTVEVEGLKCEHCSARVAEVLSRLGKKTVAKVSLNVGGVSTISVTSLGPIEAEALKGAVEGAGFPVKSVNNV